MTQDLIFHSYLPESANQLGGDLPYFVGKQYGSGWLGTLAKVAFPILKRIAGIASNAAEDVIYHEKPIKTAIADHTMGAINNLVSSPINRTGGQKRRSKQKSSNYPLFQSSKKRRKK
jgi:hypothetical protein